MRKLALGLALLSVGCIAYFGVIFEGQLPDHPVLRGKNDLVLHALAFLVLSSATMLILRWRYAVPVLIGLAGAVEIIQLFLPDRSGNVVDFLASVLGVAVAWIILAAIPAGIRATFSKYRATQ